MNFLLFFAGCFTLNYYQEAAYMFFYKHMKFRIQAQLCLAIYDFEVALCLAYV